MLLDEPIAALRTLSTTLTDVAGVLLPLATSWLAGMVKVSRNGGVFVDAVNLPVAVTAGGDGAFDLEIALAEISTPGTIHVRFYDAVDGELLGEFTDEVEATLDDYIRQNEANASERVLEATLYGLDGLLLPAATVWSAGMVKVSKAGAAFANAAALPTVVSGGGDGAFRLQFSLGEVDTVGNLRVRFYTSGGTLIGELVAIVRTIAEAAAPAAILGVVWSTEMAAEFAGDFGDASIIHTVSSTLDPSSLSGAPIRATTDHTCKALALGYDQHLIDGTRIREGDFRVIVLRGTISPSVAIVVDDTMSVIPPGGGSAVSVRVIAIEAFTEAFITARVRGAGV